MKKNTSGFTIIETLVYLGLFSIVIGGSMAAAYQVIQATNAGYNHVFLQEEANFLLRKMNWDLTGAKSFSVTTSPAMLSIEKPGFPTLTLNTNENNIQLTRGTGSPIILNTSSVSVLDVSFETLSGGRGITVSFTLTSTSNGNNATDQFFLTKYLLQ